MKQSVMLFHNKSICKQFAPGSQVPRLPDFHGSMFVLVLLALCTSDRWGRMPVLHTSLTSNATQRCGSVFVFLLQKCFLKAA